MAKKMSKRDQGLRRSYEFYLEEVVSAYLRWGNFDNLYNHYCGVVFGLGYALGYEHKDIHAEIEAAIAREEAERFKEAMELDVKSEESA